MPLRERCLLSLECITISEVCTTRSPKQYLRCAAAVPHTRNYPFQNVPARTYRTAILHVNMNTLTFRAFKQSFFCWPCRANETSCCCNYRYTQLVSRSPPQNEKNFSPVFSAHNANGLSGPLSSPPCRPSHSFQLASEWNCIQIPVRKCSCRALVPKIVSHNHNS